MTEVREREKKDMETTEMEENWRTKGTKHQFLELQKTHLVDLFSDFT